MYIRLLGSSLLALLFLFANTLLYLPAAVASPVASERLGLTQQDAEDFVPFTSDDGVFDLERPAAWEEIRYGEWIVDDKSVGVLLEVAPSLSDFYQSPEAEGLVIGLSTALVDKSRGLAFMNQSDFSADCTFDERVPTDGELPLDGETADLLLHIDVWQECGESGSAVVLMTSLANEGEYLIYLEAHVADLEEDRTVEMIIESMNINGSLFAAENPADSAGGGADADADADAEETIPGFAPYVTEDGALRLELPDSWSDVKSGPWTVDNEDFGTLIQASTDLSSLTSEEDTPGIVIGFTENPVNFMAELLLLDWYDIDEECTFDDYTEFQLMLRTNSGDTPIPAFYERYTDCGEAASILYVIEAVSDEVGVYIITQSSAAFEEATLAPIAYQTIEVEPRGIEPRGIEPRVVEPSEVADSEPSEGEAEAGEAGTGRTDTESTATKSSRSVATPTEDSVLLRLNWEEGATNTQRSIIDQVIVQTLPGDLQTIEQSIGLGYSFYVKEIDDEGVATLQVTYDWAFMRQSGAGSDGIISYDSDSPPDEIPPAALGYAGLVGQGFMMRVDSLGRVVEIDGVDAMLENMFDQIDLPPGPELDAILDALKSSFGDEALAATFEQSFNIYPDGPAQIGDSWSRPFVVRTGFPMILDNTWTLNGSADGISSIDVSSTIEPNGDAPPLDFGAFELSYSLAGTQIGTMEIDEGTGWTTSAQLTQNLDGELSADGMTIPMSIVSTIRVTGTVNATGQDDASATGDDTGNALDTAADVVADGDSDAQDDGEPAAGAGSSAADEADDADEDSLPRRSTRASSARAGGETDEADESTETDETDEATETDETDSNVGDTDDAASVEKSKLEEAQALAADGKVDEALAAFEDALADDPSLDLDPTDATVTAMVEAGQLLYFEDKTWQALQLYSSAIELDSTRPDAYVGRAAVYRWFEEYDKSLADLSAAIELGSDEYNYGTAYSERGYIYYQRDDYERAIADLSRAITAQKASGEDEVAWFYELRGYAYREVGNYADAVDDFSAAIDLDEDGYEYKWAYINRAGGYRELGDLESALADATSAIEIDPVYTWGYELRGRIYSDLDEHEQSIADLTKAIDFDQEDYDYSIAYGYRGYEYHQIDEYFEAVSDLTEAIKLLPTYTWAYEVRGDAHSDNEQYEEAIQDFTAALELETTEYDYSSVYASRGIAYYELGEYETAIDDLSEAIALNPEYTWAYEWRGYAHADVEMYEAAIADFTAAIELDQPNYAYKWAYSNRAQAYSNLGEYDAALADLDISIEIDDEYVWAYENRGDIYGLLGRYEEAMADFRMLPKLEPRSASAWNTLCWYGALFGYAAEVVDDACESAVTYASEEDVPYYRDSRGVARALTGDSEGALADFQAFIEGYGDEDLRLEWIERLEAGEEALSIFDDAMIEALLDESGMLLEEGSSGGGGEESDFGSGDSGSGDSGFGGDDSPADSLLAFTLEAADPLVAVPPLGSMLAFSKDGRLQLQSPGDPLLMAVPLSSPTPIEDQSDFALVQLELTANAKVTAVESHQGVTFDGLSGFETIATGLTTSQEMPLLIYQVILYDGDNYLTFKGLVSDAERDEFLPLFQAMVASINVE